MDTTNYRRMRGEAIAAMAGQIRRTSDGLYTVLSQTTHGAKYALEFSTRGWDCSCPDDAAYCKHAYALEQRLGAKTRADRGMMMYQAGGQVERIANDHYLVRSQSTDRAYEVRNFGRGWMCSCADHLETGAQCKHIQVVQFEGGERRIILPHDDTTCKFCDSPRIIKKGMRGKKQQYGCKACGKRFIQNMGFEGKHTTPECITLAVELVFGGLSSRKTATALQKAGARVSYKTIQRWAEQFGTLMDAFVDQIAPQVGEEWRTDEVYVQIRGNRRYLFAMLDSETRYWLAKMVAEHKGTDDVRPMFVHAKEVAGKVPSKLISDGAGNFAEAHRDEYAPRNFLWKDSVHESHIRMDGDLNNNQMESFNGNTVRMRGKVTRGLKRDDSAILTGLRLYHNHARQHLGLPDGQTPGEAAGIHILGESKWITLIQAAAKAERAES